MFSGLQREYNEQNIKESIGQLKCNACPLPDGHPSYFYQHCSNYLGNDVIDLSLNILNRNGNVSNLKDTYICLIPKVST